jgi:sugar O-acyltransferase (sialic acid O-acetyltransferase NeuD family)
MKNTSAVTIPNHLLIINASGFGRAVASLARSDLAFGKAWDVKGFLDSRNNLNNPSDLPIIDDPLNYQVQPGDIFLCALGKPSIKREYSQALIAQGANFIILRPDLTEGERVELGLGGIYERKVSLGPDVKVGFMVTILSTTIVGYDVQIGDYCQIGSFVFIGGGVRIGSDVVIHPHATILPGISIGDGAVIGAGSVVIRDVEPNITVMGNPAKPFSFR